MCLELAMAATGQALLMRDPWRVPEVWLRVVEFILSVQFAGMGWLVSGLRLRIGEWYHFLSWDVPCLELHLGARYKASPCIPLHMFKAFVLPSHE